MSNKQCVVSRPSQNPDEPNFELREAPAPSEVSGDDVLLEVLVRLPYFVVCCRLTGRTCRQVVHHAVLFCVHHYYYVCACECIISITATKNEQWSHNSGAMM